LWKKGCGINIDAWNHVWVEEGLCLMQNIDIPTELCGAKVCDLVDIHGNWNWPLFQNWMPMHIQSKIAAVLPPHADNGRDVQLGVGGNYAEFDIASMYNKLCGFEESGTDQLWRRIWKLGVTERVRCFIWLVLWDRLLTKSVKHRMGLSSPLCAYCGDQEETSIRVLRDCHLAHELWRQLVPIRKRNVFFMQNLKDWVSDNVMNMDKGSLDVAWCDIWAILFVELEK
jgi:hypothetical protein